VVIFIKNETYVLRGIHLEIDPVSVHFYERFRIILNYEYQCIGVYVPVRRDITYTLKEGKEKVLGKVEMLQFDCEINKD
jgi:hypothetical protein